MIVLVAMYVLLYSSTCVVSWLAGVEPGGEGTCFMLLFGRERDEGGKINEERKRGRRQARKKAGKERKDINACY